MGGLHKHILEQLIDRLVTAEPFDRQISRAQWTHRQLNACDGERAVGVA